MMGQILLVTGPRESGKTTLCQHMLECARAQGWRVTGILTVGHFVDGEKVSLHAQDLCTGETRVLARRRAEAKPRWAFVEETLRWGNQVLASAVPTDLLIVDELGPLELVEGRGWTAGLSAIDSRAYRYALVVVRPELVERAQQRWPGCTRLRQTPSGLFIVPPAATQ